MAGAYLPPVVVEITGNADGLVAAVAKAKAALDGLKGAGGDVKINFDANTASLVRATAAADAMTAATNRGAAGGRRWTQWLATAHNILTIFGANIVADTIGIIAFGIGATVAISPVIEAIQNLGATYGYLNPLQQGATDRLTAFINQFRQSNQAGIFAVFNSALDLVGQHIGHTGGIMDQAVQAFQNFGAMLRQTFGSSAWAQMFNRSSGVIQTDLTALFHLVDSIIGVIPALFHDFNGLGLFAINGAAGILHLVAILGEADPGLVRFASLTFLAYRMLKMLGQFNQGSLMMRGLTAAFADFAPTGNLVADTLKSIRTYGLGTTAFLLTGLTPAMLGVTAASAVAAVGLGYLLLKYSNAPSDTQKFIASLSAIDGATGNNIAGYRELSSQLGYYQNHLTDVTGKIYGTYGALNTVTNAQHALTQAQIQANNTANTLSGNFRYLENTYHLTQQQAYQLAQATGVNLTQAFAHGGGAAQIARMKVQAYEQAVNAAKNPTSVLAYDLGQASNQALQLDDRVTALTNAFNALLTPFANVIQDTADWKTGNVQLEQAVDKAHGVVNAMGNTVQRYAASQLANAINKTVNLSQVTLQQTGSMQKAIGPVRAEIGVLQALGSKSSVVAQAIRILQQYIDSLHSKTITITTILQTLHQGGSSAPTRPGYATGTGSATPGWHMVGEQGPELEYFRGGERVVPHQASMNMTKGYAGGTGDIGDDRPTVIYLDGRVIWDNIKQRTYYKNGQNNVRNPHGSVTGRMGTR